MHGKSLASGKASESERVALDMVSSSQVSLSLDFGPLDGKSVREDDNDG